MTNFRDSDYAANKYSDGIVYRFADETIVVTLADFLRENPQKTAADFAELKAESDKIYDEQARDENRQTYRNVPIQNVAESVFCRALLPEDNLAAEERRDKQVLLANVALSQLTEVQRRRYIAYHAFGQTMREIADTEGADVKSIFQSVQSAEKKIKNFL
jgi:DNA-directed RNA polymerase specialized sigma24 family protein